MTWDTSRDEVFAGLKFSSNAHKSLTLMVFGLGGGGSLRARHKFCFTLPKGEAASVGDTPARMGGLRLRVWYPYDRKGPPSTARWTSFHGPYYGHVCGTF